MLRLARYIPFDAPVRTEVEIRSELARMLQAMLAAYRVPSEAECTAAEVAHAHRP